MSGWDEVKGEHGTIVAHVGGFLRKREDLKGLYTPEGTETWKPVPHSTLIEELIAGLEKQGITVGRDGYVTMGKNDAKLLGYMDLNVPGMSRADYGMGLGIKTANDKSSAISVVAAARVFVCDNRAFAGDKGAVFLRKKHTSGLDLSRVIPPAVELFLEKSEDFAVSIEKMKEYELTAQHAKALILDSGLGKVVPMRLLKDVSRLYFDDETQRARFPERTLWTLNNAFTEATKLLDNPKRPAVRLATESRVGRYFGKTVRPLNPTRTQVALPGDVEIIDAAEARAELN